VVQASPVRNDAVVVAAARAGDREAMNELARRHLPMVYNLVRQALGDDPDVDDVVQDVLVRAWRQLPDLREPGSFRPWLAAIAVRQTGTHLARADLAARRAAPLDEAIGRPDAASEVEGPALVRAELAGQRRQVGHATRWMGADERTVFSLWWLETLGELTRSEVATALGTSVAHTGVRIQRMREQLEASRRIVVALEAAPGCDVLDEVVADWDGVPGPYWRKRIDRHVRTCPVCGRAARDLWPADRLLVGLVLLPVPAAVAAAVLAKAVASGASAGVAVTGAASWLGRVVQAAVAHPAVAATIGVGVVAAGVAVPLTGGSAPDERTVAVAPAPPTSPAPSAAAPSSRAPAGTAATTAPLRIGRLSLESAAEPGRFVSVDGDNSVLAPARDAAARERATLRAVAGVADPSCYSFRRPDGRYLRHSLFRLRLSHDDGTRLFREDATFCGRPGFLARSVSLQSFNYRDFYLRYVGDQMGIGQYDGSAGLRATSSFVVRPPLAG
jgi:RNA polymerase sigma factor (sigma-70 family)